jgi:hypothetical protein
MYVSEQSRGPGSRLILTSQVCLEQRHYRRRLVEDTFSWTFPGFSEPNFRKILLEMDVRSPELRICLPQVRLPALLSNELCDASTTRPRVLTLSQVRRPCLDPRYGPQDLQLAQLRQAMCR